MKRSTGPRERSKVSAAKRLARGTAFAGIALAAALFGTACNTTPKRAAAPKWAAASKPAPAGKFYHVGLVWLKDAGNAEHRQKIVAAAHAFAREIPEVHSLSVGQSPPSSSPLVDDSFDVSFVMQVEDKAALDRYGKHPVHEKAAREVFLPLSRKILFYDFISE